MAAFQFEVGLQRSILRLMMVDDVFCIKAMQHVESGFFTTEALGWVFTVLENYWSSYQRRCGDMQLIEASRHVPSEKLVHFRVEVDSVIFLGELVSESEWIKEQLGDFCRRNAFSVAHQESAELFNAGKTIEAYDVMARAQDEIAKISFEDIDRQWYFEELGDRQSIRMAKSMLGSTGLPTGIADLDRATDGGIQPGEVWSVLAYAKRCKTTWLCNQTYLAIRRTATPVVHFMLEGHGHQIANKYDSLFSNELYRNVRRGDIEPHLYADLENRCAQYRKLLVIRTLNDWDVNTQHVKSELQELKSYGFKPGLMILDYVDLLRSRYKADSETKHQVEASRDLKRLVNQEMIACWTAWQAQRPKPNAHTVKHTLSAATVADAYAKVRIVDAYGSLNATDEEMDNGEMRVFWEAHRDNPVNQTWAITNDLSRSRMVTGAEVAEVVSADMGEKQG